MHGASSNDHLVGLSSSASLYGKDGDDTYFVTDSNNVFENESEGTDEILTLESTFTIPNNVENLEFWSATEGHINSGLTYYGNESDNTIITSNGDDVLYGYDGNDRLFGLAGDDNIFGGDGDDELYGGIGNDTLEGGNGNDTLSGYTMYGGLGDDYYIISSSSQTIHEYANEGEDTIYTSLDSYTLSSSIYKEVENLTASSSGVFTGNMLNNTITGSSQGNDVLDGYQGENTLIGLGGDDVYYVNNINDVVVESMDQGDDTIISYVNYSLPDNVENIRSTGNMENLNFSGNDLDNEITGTWGNNILIGGDGNDILDGTSGNDQLIGGLGDDKYILREGDAVTENENEGYDWIVTDLNYYVLPDNFEKLTSFASADSFEFYGNDADNYIGVYGGVLGASGENGADIAYGGLGDDQIFASSGDDTLFGEAGNDYLDGGNGNDYLYGGSGDDRLFGNDHDDYLFGGAGNDVLYGNDGNNFLSGNTGRDIYYGGINNGTDTFYFELGDSSFDVSDSSASYSNGFYLDQINRYTKGADRIQFSEDLSIGGDDHNDQPTSDVASINLTTGVATFATGSGTTMADAINDIVNSFNFYGGNYDNVGDFAFFKINEVNSYYMFISDGDSSTSNDIIFHMNQVTQINSIDTSNDWLEITG